MEGDKGESQKKDVPMMFVWRVQLLKISEGPFV